MSMIIQAALVYLISDKGGSWLAKLLSDRGMLGLGTGVGKKLAERRLRKSADAAREEHLAWLQAEIKKESQDGRSNTELESG
tara:strand:- start:247 stop:492 length:246 start_codon:yes stop_codon:yes gene_type:complete